MCIYDYSSLIYTIYQCFVSEMIKISIHYVNPFVTSCERVVWMLLKCEFFLFSNKKQSCAQCVAHLWKNNACRIWSHQTAMKLNIMFHVSLISLEVCRAAIIRDAAVGNDILGSPQVSLSMVQENANVPLVIYDCLSKTSICSFQ